MPTTRSPTLQRTLRPTKVPTARATKSPSALPTTKTPTVRPTTSKPTARIPTVKPTTAQPTTRTPTMMSTSGMPTTRAPTLQPTTGAPTFAPTPAPTHACPAGTFSVSGYGSSTAQCKRCNPGRYDLPSSSMRTSCDTTLPCTEPGYWCGPGAVKGRSYVQAVENDDLQGSIVTASESVFTVEFTKLVDETVVIFADRTMLPPGVRLAHNVTSPATELAGTSFYVDLIVVADLLQGLSGEGGNLFQSNLTLFGRYAEDADNLAAFSATVSMEIHLVSVVISPSQFSFNLMWGSRYSSTLSPLPVTTILNPLCENSLYYTVSLCDSDAATAILEFGPDTVTEDSIVHDQGLGKKVDFLINLADLDEQEDWRLPARNITACLVFDMWLTPLDIQFVRKVTVDVKVLQRCPAGTYSVSGTNEFGCTACEDGTYQPHEGSAMCFPVSPGFEANDGNSDIYECELGYMSTLQTPKCFPCPLGTYSDVNGSTLCKPCPSSTFPITLDVGSASIEACTTDATQEAFKNLMGALQACPSGTTCNFAGATVETIKVDPGHYRTSSSSLDIRKCKPKFCVPDYYDAAGEAEGEEIADDAGQDDITNNARRRRRRRRQLSSYSSQDDDEHCTPHHRGHLCEICETGYVHRGEARLCQLCEDETTAEDVGRISGLFAAFVIVLCVVSSVALLRWYESYKPKPHIPFLSMEDGAQPNLTRWQRATQWLAGLLSFTDARGTPFKIMIGYFQVVAGMSLVLEDYLPEYFSVLANMFSLLSLDFIKVFDFGCSLPDQDHFKSLLLATLVPMAFLAFLFLMERTLRRCVHHPDILHVGFMNLYLWILFLIYPSIAKTIFQTFDCIRFDDGMAFIEADPQIDCNSEYYRGLFAYGIFSILIFVVGVPVWFYILLDRQRFQLDACPDLEPRVSLAYREKNLQVQTTAMLWAGYSPKRYNFEVFELLRKLFQTSVFVFVSRDGATQVIFLLAICAVVVVVLGWLEPYVTRSHNALAQWAQWNIFAIAFVALLNGMQLAGEAEQDALDVLLLLLLVSMPVFVIVISVAGMSPRQFVEDVKTKVGGMSTRHLPQQQPDAQLTVVVGAVSLGTAGRSHTSRQVSDGGGYAASAVNELRDLVNGIDPLTAAARDKMLRMIAVLEDKYMEEQKVAQLERSLLRDDQMEVGQLRAKIHELASDNAEIRAASARIEEELRLASEYKEADADMFKEGGAGGVGLNGQSGGGGGKWLFRMATTPKHSAAKSMSPKMSSTSRSLAGVRASGEGTTSITGRIRRFITRSSGGGGDDQDRSALSAFSPPPPVPPSSLAPPSRTTSYSSSRTKQPRIEDL